MLVIRNEQLRILNQPFEKKFRDLTAAYLETDFPELARRLGPEGVRQFIEYGISKATGYGVELEADLCDWIGAMAKLGRDFEQLDWAAEILQDKSEPLSGRLSRLMGWVEVMSKIPGK